MAAIVRNRTNASSQPQLTHKQESVMFESIVSKITNIVRKTVRALGTATHKSPWLAPIAILALFCVL